MEILIVCLVVFMADEGDGPELRAFCEAIK